MQFVTNGPDIPEALLQAHEEGRVVFFCGAGISSPAGLPGFKDLVDDIYRRVGDSRNAIEQEAYDHGQFDATLDLLERRVAGQRVAVRKVLIDALKPNLRRKGATDTHAALLQLARNREGVLRLVTTNFDRIFERIAKRTKQSINSYAAPMFPIPKNSRWNGLVYLHGLLPEREDKSALQRLVLTSGDFGLAYLTERWAARFVSELFSNYIVCFVGYSINDPVLRYMMDALAADRILGEITPQAYALGDCEPGKDRDKTIEWEAKGVTPILYKVPTGSDHSALRSTLKAWAETYRDGILGKERVVVDYALVHPSASTQQDDFVGRMLWALSHESGLPAKRFAEFNPAPPLEWLEVFSDERYLHDDLDRFGVQPHSKVDDKLRFSLIRRPAHYSRTPRMSLVSSAADIQWDDVMSQLARWLVRHLNDPKLIIWLAERGGQLHSQWCRLIEGELDRFSRLAREDKTAELDKIRANAPNAIPQPLMRTLWRLLLTNRVKSPWRNWNIYSWQDQLKHDGLTTTLRLQLRELLAPKVVLKKPFHWSGSDEEDDTPERMKQQVDWELALATDHVHSLLRALSEAEHWRNALPRLLDDFQQLLRDALDLLQELGETVDFSDRSHWHLPSISPHWQNRGFCDWVALVELLRDAWLATRDTDPDRANRIVQGWFALPYATFKRLALFAASHDGCVATDQWVDWLISDDSRWLWSTDTQRETMRLLVLQGTHLSPEASAKLQTTILAGPPREKFQDDTRPEWWQSHVDYSIWLRLAKFQAGGSRLSTIVLSRFTELSKRNPKWKLADNERDEFTHWMSGTGDPDYVESGDIDIAPRKRQDLVKWLKESSPERSRFYEDTWRETCQTRFFHSFFALCDLTREEAWPTGRWGEALQAWSEEGNVLRSWRFAAPLIQAMPDNVLREILHAVAWWLKAISKSIDRNETILLDLCQRILELPYQDSVDTDQPVSRAINHPIGYVAQALLNFWFKCKPNDNDALPKEIEPLFTQICDITVKQFRHGRVLLASHLIALFRVDRSWTETHLLPLFDWEVNSVEAKAVWEGFLWSPRLYRPLLVALKDQFLSTAHHYAELGEHSDQFPAFLTYVALDRVDGYTSQDFQSAISALPQEGLQKVAQTLSQALEGAGEQREDYWKNRIQPFWQKIWPKSRELASNSIAESLARLSIAAHGEFPSALSTVLDWLQPIECPDNIIRLLHESGLAGRFPEDALRLLAAIIDKPQWVPKELEQCLNAISQVSPPLEKDHRYKRLMEHVRQRGI